VDEALNFPSLFFLSDRVFFGICEEGFSDVRGGGLICWINEFGRDVVLQPGTYTLLILWQRRATNNGQRKIDDENGQYQLFRTAANKGKRTIRLCAQSPLFPAKNS
jgi:hypothetical protein